MLSAQVHPLIMRTRQQHADPWYLIGKVLNGWPVGLSSLNLQSFMVIITGSRYGIQSFVQSRKTLDPQGIMRIASNLGSILGP